MTEKKEIVVVAREGYQVLLNVGPQTLDISCYVPVNLSRMFSETQLDNCASLRAHLEDGNLIYYNEGQPIPKDPHAVQIKPLTQASTTKIEAQFTQKTQTPAVHVQVETDVDIDSAKKQDIQDRVVAGREEILAKDRKILEARKTDNVINVGSQPPRQEAMTSEKLQLKVQMDVDPAEFKRKQQAAHKQLQAKEHADEQRAMQEIAQAEANQED